jgi:hypothetical protein
MATNAAARYESDIAQHFQISVDRARRDVAIVVGDRSVDVTKLGLYPTT